jgi:hypothetical protein
MDKKQKEAEQEEADLEERQLKEVCIYVCMHAYTGK